MSNEHMKTDITDNYPYLNQLECQFYEVCAFYKPGECQYNKPCRGHINVGEGKAINLRTLMRKTIEDYVEVEDLKLQIDLIRKEEMRDDDEECA